MDTATTEKVARIVQLVQEINNLERELTGLISQPTKKQRESTMGVPIKMRKNGYG